jgi:hypothetical protein
MTFLDAAIPLGVGRTRFSGDAWRPGQLSARKSPASPLSSTDHSLFPPFAAPSTLDTRGNLGTGGGRMLSIPAGMSRT